MKLDFSPRWTSRFVLLLSSFVCTDVLLADDTPTPGLQVAQKLVSPALPSEPLGYWMFLPKDYGTDDRKWPVMLFLHGAGERGDDLKLVKVHGPPKLVDARPDFPFIVISPQCPKDQWWPGDIQQHLLAELVDSVLTRFKADRERVVVTGLSMGGFGSWTMTAKYPDRFSASVPICGGGDPNMAEKLKTVPFWVFHGAKDVGVPLRWSEVMVDAIQKAGGSAKLTVYPEAEHDSWTETYQNEAVYDWLLAQRRTSPAPLPTVDPNLAFARIGKTEELKLGDPGDKNTFAATLYLRTTPANAAELHKKLIATRARLLAEFIAWVHSQPTESLIGKAGQQHSQAAAQTLCDKILFNGQPPFEAKVAFDLYFVRHKGVLKLESK